MDEGWKAMTMVSAFDWNQFVGLKRKTIYKQMLNSKLHLAKVENKIDTNFIFYEKKETQNFVLIQI